MKNYAPYILIALIAGAIIALVIAGGKKKARKVFDQRITLNRKDKIPYGTYAAHKLLKTMLPEAKIINQRREPGYWDSVDTDNGRQAFVFIGHKFAADEYEMKNLLSFAESGNDVFIAASYISATADEKLKCNSSSLNADYFNYNELEDSLITTLKPPFVDENKLYTYPGLNHGSYFTSIDTTVTDVLGINEKGRPNFIHIAAGKGHLYIHLEPLLFTNYFILYKNNKDYFEKAMSVINPATQTVIWDEYYTAKQNNDNNNASNNNRKGWFQTLMGMEGEDENGNKTKPFRWSFWLLLLLLLLYVLMEMRRKRRYVPVIKPPKNDSLDFVKTIGRLYYDKGDHKNLCRKMAAYFLEYVRMNYKIPTNELNDKFVTQLQYKSGAAEHEIRSIVSFIKFMDDGGFVTREHLLQFNNELETFYQKA